MRGARGRPGLPFLLALLPALALAAPAPAARHRTVLIINSFQNRWETTTSLMTDLRAGLQQRSDTPLYFSEFPLEVSHQVDPRAADLAAAYLRQTFEQAPPSLLITMGAPAAEFVTRRRADFFPAAPLVITLCDVARIASLPLGPNDYALPNRHDPVVVVNRALELVPSARSVIFIAGAQANERAWLRLLRPMMPKALPHLQFHFTEDETFASIRDRLAAAGPDTIAIYILFGMDGAGEAFDYDRALPEFAKASTAPLFAVDQGRVGSGILGAIHSDREATVAAALEICTDILQGNLPPHVSRPPLENLLVTLDARQLPRWDLDPRRLPEGTRLRFAEESPWVKYGAYIVVGLVVLALQTALIVVLVANRRRRQKAEAASNALRRKLLTAEEDERKAIARDLHDDIAQRVARLTLDTAVLDGDTARAAKLREDLDALGREVNGVAYRLHPATLDSFGLVDSLREACEGLAQRSGLGVQFQAPGVTSPVPASLAAQVLRIAQESLRNVERHAKAREVRVSLAWQADGLQLVVEDDGVGFDARGARKRYGGLGLSSMRERVELLGGEFEVDSRPGEGTTMLAWIPHQAA